MELCSLPVIHLGPNYGGSNEDNGNLLQEGYVIPRSTAPRAPAPAAVHCWPVPPQEILKHSSVLVSLGSGSWCTQGLFEPSEWLWQVWDLVLNVIFAPPAILLGLLCPWMWGISLKLLQCHAAAAPGQQILFLYNTMLYTRLVNLMFFQIFTGMSLIGPSYPPFRGFPGGTVVKNLPANARDTHLISGPRRSSGEGNGNLLQYSSLGNPMDRGAWWATVHGVATATKTATMKGPS